jgi:hypothetical protein
VSAYKECTVSAYRERTVSAYRECTVSAYRECAVSAYKECTVSAYKEPAGRGGRGGGGAGRRGALRVGEEESGKGGGREERVRNLPSLPVLRPESVGSVSVAMEGPQGALTAPFDSAATDCLNVALIALPTSIITSFTEAFIRPVRSGGIFMLSTVKRNHRSRRSMSCNSCSVL